MDFGDEALDPDVWVCTRCRWGSGVGGFWANLSPEAPALLDDLGGFAAEADGFPVSDYRFSHEVVH